MKKATFVSAREEALTEEVAQLRKRQLPPWDQVPALIRGAIIRDAFAATGRRVDAPGAIDWYEAIRKNIAKRTFP